jgi:tetratricopeptide (TPR) repeat protein
LAPAGARPTPTLRPRARLADVIGKARLAEQAGDLDRAIDLLNEAAAIDVEAGKVRETAQDLVTALVARSDQAAAEADWERAAALLERARDLALRFDLPTRPIDQAARRQGGLERYRRLGPQDIAALRAAIGSKVTVFTHDGTREGRLVGVTTSALELQLGLDVADNGTLLHTGQVPLASVREVRVYPD